MTGVIDKRKYAALLSDVLPQRIETEEENERYLALVEKMIDKGAENLTPEEDKLFDLLVTLIEEFEEKTYPDVGSSSTPLSMLHFLMDQHGLKQKDIVPVFGSQGIASEVLNGKRAISKNQAKKLAEKFKVSAELFI